MDDLIITAKTYWLQFLSAVVVGLAGVFHKWIIKRVKAMFVWFKTFCPGKSIMHRLDEISAELKPNHGTSIKDSVNRIENDIKSVSSKINIVVTGLDMVSDTLNICRWAADSNGKINYVNKPLRELIGSTDDSAWSLGDAWSNVVYKEDRDAAIEEWERCVKSKIEYHDSYRILNIQTNKIIKITSHAKIVKNLRGGVEGWAGVVISHQKQSTKIS